MSQAGLGERNGSIKIVLKLVDGIYSEHGVFQGGDRINSPRFGLLPMTAEQILRAGE